MSNKNNLKCAKCLNPLLVDGIKCGLFCGKVFHKICTGICDESIKEIGKNNSNISYHCSDCAKFPVRELFTKVNDLVSVVDVLTKKLTDFDSLYVKLSEMVHLQNETSKNNFVPLDVATTSQQNNKTSSPSVIAIEKNVCSDESPSQKENNNVIANPKNVSNNRKRRRRRRTSAVIVGVDNLPDNMSVITPTKWLHVSKFSVSTSEESIRDYVSNKLNIPINEIQCYKLIKKDSDVSNFKFINFKVGIPASKINDATNINNWPTNVCVKSFKHVPKNDNNSPRQQIN